VVGFDSALSPCLTPAREDLRERCARPSEEAHLEESHPIRRLALVALAALCALAAASAVSAPLAGARAGQLQQNRDEARAIAAEISALDARIGSAVTRYSRATRALEAVRRQLDENRRLQRLAYRELSLARATLAARAVAMYKHNDVTPMDAFIGAADLSDLVTQLTMVRTIARSDRDIVRTIEATKRELKDRRVTLAADERTAQELVGACKAELTTIRARLDERRAALAGLRSDIRRLVAEAQKAAPDPAPTVEPPDAGGGGGGDGAGPWWSLIQSAAASNGVSARGMYRLMMIESGGSATVVGPGGYYGLFQYAPATWAGSWNPWRSASITDGAAQIKATALAIHQGNGHAWWDPSYTWAFQGD
jgi:peptidoglycan hydrolase CwlO-like protein